MRGFAVSPPGKIVKIHTKIYAFSNSLDTTASQKLEHQYVAGPVGRTIRSYEKLIHRSNGGVPVSAQVCDIWLLQVRLIIYPMSLCLTYAASSRLLQEGIAKFRC